MLSFTKILKYVEKSYEGKPSFLILLSDGKEYISNGCVFMENTDRNVEFLIKKFNCKEELEVLFSKDELTSYNGVVDCSYMLHGCFSLTEVKLELPMATNCYSMLYGCSSLTEVKLELPMATNCYSMLEGCSSLTEVKLELPMATDCYSMLEGCSSLTEANILTGGCKWKIN